MTTPIPEIPDNSFRITLELDHREPRLDNVLLNALREQHENRTLKIISRAGLKRLFNDKKILIKGQSAKPSSSLTQGITYIDILL